MEGPDFVTIDSLTSDNSFNPHASHLSQWKIEIDKTAKTVNFAGPTDRKLEYNTEYSGHFHASHTLHNDLKG